MAGGTSTTLHYLEHHVVSSGDTGGVRDVTGVSGKK